MAASGAAAATLEGDDEASATGATATTTAPAPNKRDRRERRRQAAAAKPSGGYRAPGSVGERPEAPWHPFPLSELLILIGAVATVVGLSKLKHGIGSGGATLIVGIVAVLVGTVEFTLREHLSGYRSHTTLLAAIPAVVVFTGSLLIVSAFVSPIPTVAKVAPLALALPLFAVLFRALRGRFKDARRERVAAGKR
jgi:uncharacterized membrane protein